MDSDNKMLIDIDAEIGITMNDEDVSGDYCGKRYYAIETLAFALSAVAREQVDAGMDVTEVIGHTLDAITRDLQANLPDLDVKVGHMGSDNKVVIDEKNGGGVLPA